MIFACGDQTFFKIDESILTGSMLPKINIVADKTTIRKLNAASIELIESIKYFFSYF